MGVVGLSYGSLASLWLPGVGAVRAVDLRAGGRLGFMFIGIVASGGNPLAAAAAGLLVNARHVPFGVTVRDLVGRRGASLLGCHIMNDESVVFGLSQKTPEQRKAAYWLCGLGVAIIWPLGALLGALVGKILPAPETIGLDAVFPAILLALVIPAFKNRTTLIRACSRCGVIPRSGLLCANGPAGAVLPVRPAGEGKTDERLSRCLSSGSLSCRQEPT